MNNLKDTIISWLTLIFPYFFPSWTIIKFLYFSKFWQKRSQTCSLSPVNTDHPPPPFSQGLSLLGCTTWRLCGKGPTSFVDIKISLYSFINSLLQVITNALIKTHLIFHFCSLKILPLTQNHDDLNPKSVTFDINLSLCAACVLC